MRNIRTQCIAVYFPTLPSARYGGCGAHAPFAGRWCHCGNAPQSVTKRSGGVG